MATAKKLSPRETRKFLSYIKKSKSKRTTPSKILEPETRSVTIYKDREGEDVAIKKITSGKGGTITRLTSRGKQIVLTPNSTYLLGGKTKALDTAQLNRTRQILLQRAKNPAYKTPIRRIENDRKLRFVDTLVQRQKNLKFIEEKERQLREKEARKTFKERLKEKKENFREKANKEGSFYNQTEANISYVKGSKAFKKGVDIVDVISGGKISEKKIMKQQEALNKSIEQYNKDYEGKKELPATQYEISKSRFENLEKRQKDIDKQKEAWANSNKVIKGLVRGIGNEPWVSEKEKQQNLKEIKQGIKDSRAKIKKLEDKLKGKEAKGKEAKLLKFRIKTQEKILQSKFDERERYKAGQGKKVIATTVPISVATLGTPTGIKGIKEGLKQLYGIGKGGTVTKVKGKTNTYTIKVSKTQAKKILTRRKALEKYYKSLARKKAKAQPFRQRVIKIKKKLTPKKLGTLVKKLKRGTTRKVLYQDKGVAVYGKRKLVKPKFKLKKPKIKTPKTLKKVSSSIKRRLTRKVLYTDDKITIYGGRRLAKPKIKLPKIKPKVPRRLTTLINKLKRTRTYKVKAVGKGKKVFVYMGKKLVKPKFKLPKIKKPKIKIPKKIKPKFTRKVVYQDKGVTVYKGRRLLKPKITKGKPKIKPIKKGGGVLGYEKAKAVRKPKLRKGIYEYRKVGNRYVRKLKYVKDKAKPIKDIIVDIRTPKPKYRTVRTSGGGTSRQLVKQKPKVTVKIPREYYNKVTRARIKKIIKNMKPAQKQKLAKALQKDLKKIKSYKKAKAIAQYQKQLQKQYPKLKIKQLQIGGLVSGTDSLTKLRRILAGGSLIDLLGNSRVITPEKFKEYQKQNLRGGQKSGQGEEEVVIPTQKPRTVEATAQVQPTALRQVLTSVGIPRTTIKKGIVGLNKKQLQKLQKKGYKMGYNVYGKSGNKYLKINKKPLSKLDAISKGTYAIDRTTSRTLKVEPIGLYKSLGYLSKKEKSYASKNKQKFREYKLKKGVAIKLKKKYIEKRKYLIDSRGEKKGLTLAKYLAKQKPKVKRMKGGRIWYGWKTNRKTRK